MEKDTCSYRTSIASSFESQEVLPQYKSAVLDYQRLSNGNQTELSSMGVQRGTNVLAHQRDDLSRQSEEKLG